MYWKGGEVLVQNAWYNRGMYQGGLRWLRPYVRKVQLRNSNVYEPHSAIILLHLIRKHSYSYYCV